MIVLGEEEGTECEVMWMGGNGAMFRGGYVFLGLGGGIDGEFIWGSCGCGGG